MKMRLVLVMTLVVAGCATPNELRQGKPELRLNSVKNAKNVAICIADKWENGGPFGPVPLSMRETQSGYMVSVMCETNTCMLADVASLPDNRSETVVYMNAVGASDYLNDVTGCQ